MIEQLCRMAPEFTVSDLDASLTFWRDLIGFEVIYAREAEGFTFLSLGPMHIMLE